MRGKRDEMRAGGMRLKVQVAGEKWSDGRNSQDGQVRMYGCGEEGVGAMWKQGGRSGECRERRERERWKGGLDV